MRKRKGELPLALLVIGTLAAAAAWGDGSALVLTRPTDREQVVRAAYVNLARYLEASGQKATFEIRNVRTFEAADFDEIYWLDVVTMPSGEMIDVTPTRVTNTNGTRGAYYVPQWQLDGSDYLGTEEGRLLTGMKVDALLQRIGATNPEMLRVQALTTYEVEARLGERTRTYRAAVLWLPPVQKGTSATLYLQDHITQGVEDALLETLPARTKARLEADALLNAPVQTKAGEVCEWESHLQDETSSSQDFSGHITGRHSSSATVRFQCECESNCTSRCIPSFITTSCADTGTPSTSCHKMSRSSELQSGVKFSALSAGAGCAAGFGCVMKPCLFCACSLGVTVTFAPAGVGFNITFTPSGNPDWQGNLRFNAECGPCVQSLGNEGGYSGPDIQRPPDSPDGGWYSPGGCHSYCTSWMSNGKFYMYCDTYCY